MIIWYINVSFIFLLFTVPRLSLFSPWWSLWLSRRRNPPKQSPSNRHGPSPSRRKRLETREGCCWTRLTRPRSLTVHTPLRPSLTPHTATPTRTRPILATPITPRLTERPITWPRYAEQPHKPEGTHETVRSTSQPLILQPVWLWFCNTTSLATRSRKIIHKKEHVKWNHLNWFYLFVIYLVTEREILIYKVLEYGLSKSRKCYPPPLCKIIQELHTSVFKRAWARKKYRHLYVW